MHNYSWKESQFEDSVMPWDRVGGGIISAFSIKREMSIQYSQSSPSQGFMSTLKGKLWEATINQLECN